MAALLRKRLNPLYHKDLWLRPRAIGLFFAAALALIAPIARVNSPALISSAGVSAWNLGLETAYAAALLGAATQVAALTSSRFAFQVLPGMTRVGLETVSIATMALLCGLLAASAALWLPWGDLPDQNRPSLTLPVLATALQLGALGALCCRLNLSPFSSGLALCLGSWLLPAIFPNQAAQILLDPSAHLDHWIQGMTKARLLADMMPVAAIAIAAGLLPSPRP